MSSTPPVTSKSSASTSSVSTTTTSKPKVSTASIISGGAEKKTAAIPATVIKGAPAVAAIVASSPPVKSKTKTTTTTVTATPVVVKSSKTAVKKQESDDDDDDEMDESEDEEDDEEEDIEDEEERSEDEDEESEDEPEVDVSGKCLLCTNDSEDLKPMFTSRMDHDVKKQEKILCEFCYQFLHMSFEVQGTCKGVHKVKEFEGVFLPHDVSLKRQEDCETPVTYDEIRKMKRYCFDCIQDILPWNNRDVIKTLRRAYRMIKSVAKNCPVCFENSVTVTNRGPRLRLCDLCKDDFQNAKNDTVMCLGCRDNTAVMSKAFGAIGKARDICFDCLQKNREKRLLEIAENYRQRKTPELVAKLQRENNAFCAVLASYIENLKVVKAAAKPRKKKEKASTTADAITSTATAAAQPPPPKVKRETSTMEEA